MNAVSKLSLTALVALAALACKEPAPAAAEPAPPAPPAPPAAAPAKTTAAAAPAAAPAPAATADAPKPTTGLQVAKIVFVGKQDACECTRKRIDDSWAALQAAFAKKGTVPVEKLQIDTQADDVAFYQGLNKIMVVPALYFLDAKGGLVSFLQGEVSAAQAEQALK